jgi:hypothetical protein
MDEVRKSERMNKERVYTITLYIYVFVKKGGIAYCITQNRKWIL